MDKVRSHKYPSPFTERSVIDVSGGGYFFTFNKGWVDQWGVSEGDYVMVWVKEDSDRIYVEPYEGKKYSSLQNDGLDVLWKKEVKSFGDSYGMFLKKTELEDDLSMRQVGTILQTSNHTMVMEPYSRKRAKELQSKWREFIMGNNND